MVTRSSKRKTSEASPSKQPASKKSSTKKGSSEGSPIEEIEEDAASGMPFIDEEIEWIRLRNPKAKLAGVKVSFGGYETSGIDIGNITRSLPRPILEELSKSCMGEFLRMQFLLTRCQQMICYVMNHEVTPKPNFDKMSRFFKFGDVVCRFGRREYALVSGLKFGPANFDPYAKHEIPENSVFERMFGSNDETTLVDLRSAYIKKNYNEDGELVDVPPEDIVKLTKMYIAVSLVLGFDNSKKKIPEWLWVLVENDEEWEKFPWGSLAFQILLSNIDGFKRSGNNFTLKGDTIGFSAWIYEVLPNLGDMLGERASYPAIPRILRYSYSMMKRGGFPKDDVVLTKIVQVLEPTRAEEETVWWKSLELEPSQESFALKYDQYYAKRKESRKEKVEEDEEFTHQGRDLQLQITECKKVLDELPEKLKGMLDAFRVKIVDEVAEKVAKTLLENAPPYTEPNFDHVIDIANAYNKDGEGASDQKNEDGGERAKVEEGAQPTKIIQQGVNKESEGEDAKGTDPKTPVEPKV